MDYDTIHIRDMSLKCCIGILPREKKKKQEILISMVIFTDIKKAAETDDIENAIDYREVEREIRNYVNKTGFNLIETLAENIAEQCLKRPGIHGVRIVIKKPGALKKTAFAGIEIQRFRKGDRDEY